MAAGDLTDLQGRVQSRGSFNTSDVGLTAAKLTEFINAALKQISAERDWPHLFTTETITTAAADSTYTLPAGHIRTDAIVDPTTGDTLIERQIEELDRITGAGRPMFWAAYGTEIVVKPIPDGVYTLTHRYVRSETALSAGGDLPLLPRHMDEGVVEWATMLAHTFTRELDKAAEAGARYNAWLKATVDNVLRGRRPRRVQVLGATSVL